MIGVIAPIAGQVLNAVGRPTIPTWAQVSIGLLGLFVAQFLAFHKLRLQRDKLKSQLDDKSRRRAIKDSLGQFLNEGSLLRGKCANENEPPPNKEADDWAARVEAYLTEYCGSSYVSRFRSDAGLPMVATSISSRDHRNLWGGIHTRLSRLEQFISELAD